MKQKIELYDRFTGLYFKGIAMKFAGKSVLIFRFLGVFTISLAMITCESSRAPDPGPGISNHLLDFPSFITPSDQYFQQRIGEIPIIDQDTYRLKISGAIDTPGTFSLEELSKLEMTKRTLAIECIGNPVNGPLLGHASWTGFSIYNLLEGLGIKEGVSNVKYICADGYYTYNTLDELQSAEVLGALYMNEDPIPAKYGFPLRIIFPGYYGVRQPGWIVEIELLEEMEEDYFQRSGWKTERSMAIDSKIFFPLNNSQFALGDSIKIGGAAYGSKRISGVDISLDDGLTWTPATITRKLNEDYTWVFWEYMIKPQSAGLLTISSRATGQDGTTQPGEDMDYSDGTNSWPKLTIHVD